MNFEFASPKKAKLRKLERSEQTVSLLPLKKQNSGNQPEFQSSIKKRTVVDCCCGI
jgi:hypothetical protein